MRRELWANRPYAIAVGVGGLMALVGSFLGWMLARSSDGATRSLDPELELVPPLRIAVGVSGGVLIAIAIGLFLVRRPLWGVLLRVLAAFPLLVALMIVVLGWLDVAMSYLPGGALPSGTAGGETEIPDVGFWLITVGTIVASVGVLLRPRRTTEVAASPLITRPREALPLSQDELTPGWYDVDGVRRWWDGRAWVDAAAV